MCKNWLPDYVFVVGNWKKQITINYLKGEYYGSKQ